LVTAELEGLLPLLVAGLVDVVVAAGLVLVAPAGLVLAPGNRTQLQNENLPLRCCRKWQLSQGRKDRICIYTLKT
jgi:hypothetical protein